MDTYLKYSTYLREKYGEKVYKLPIQLPVTCPNRDGTCGSGGCTFCGDIGTGFEMYEATESIAEQLQKNKDYMGKRYKARLFIAYFQNYSNTYMSLEAFSQVIETIRDKDIVEIAVSTRPDCIHPAYLEILKAWAIKHQKEICIELGLQTINYHTLKKINRGHGLAEYLDAILMIKSYGFKVCTHVILNLPWDTEQDTIETAKCLSVLQSDYVKLHALYLIKGTPLAKAYEKGNFEMLSLEGYKERVKLFLRYLNPQIVVQRLIGRAPEEVTIFANWDTSWWKIHDDLVAEMQESGQKQGDLYNYRQGKAVRRWTESS
ncbi:TIGR01212 family radical SAM protein [Sporanaerobium hydrogeniformans]|uniref:TIGR01212 family radical SAM protein n=1 Tax=Sporanaerobium hydrogeniformans TaxID=3072179 RepID=A0AC61DFJ0_9FIRM|nr:TIGR01212 family radical SAM protein [Sporanaerobium hydrogeniformans]PHV71466.1 TIGR01212 family radical SAM protein [Sporanaerobium hydrogeniformans]